jgi:hypothetical protein
MDSVRTATYSNAAPLIVQLNLRRTAITKSPGQTGTGAKFVLGLEQVTRLFSQNAQRCQAFDRPKNQESGAIVETS